MFHYYMVSLKEMHFFPLAFFHFQRKHIELCWVTPEMDHSRSQVKVHMTRLQVGCGDIRWALSSLRDKLATFWFSPPLT